MAEDKQVDQNNFLNHTAYKGGFILTPETNPENPKARYKHFTKDFAMTNLRLDKNSKNPTDEPAQMTAILNGLHVLTNPGYFEIIKDKKLVYVEDREYEYKVLDSNGDEQLIVIKKPVYEEKEVDEEVSIFPKVYHLLESKTNTMVEVTNSTNGHRAKISITDRHEKEESVQDKTEVKSNGWFGGKSQGGERR